MFNAKIVPTQNCNNPSFSYLELLNIHKFTLRALFLSSGLYIADCKDKSKILKPYLPKKRTVVVLKTLVLEHV